ncbi:hypothetical protein MC885_007088 [Smutsia gigantea]|nr:hypothetical protein MC885_007088 [Smutsia gigantea]
MFSAGRRVGSTRPGAPAVPFGLRLAAVSEWGTGAASAGTRRGGPGGASGPWAGGAWVVSGNEGGGERRLLARVSALRTPRPAGVASCFRWIQAIFQHLFTRIPSKLFHSPVLAFEFIHFCKDSLPLFGRNHGILRLSFPNLCKSCFASLGQWGAGVSGRIPGLQQPTPNFLVRGPAPSAGRHWHGCGDAARTAGPARHDRGHGPMTQSNLMQSTSLGPGSLACLSLSRKDSVALGHFQSPRGWSSPAASEKPLWDASLRASSCLEALWDPQCQPLSQYLLRATASPVELQSSRGHSGPGAPGLAPLHQLLQPLVSCAWVGQCSQAVPTLLQAFLAVTKYVDGALANQLALLLLERSDSLYQVPQYDAQVHRVLSSQFLALCRQQPSLVVELAKELLDNVGSVSDHLSAGLMRTSMINRYFDVLEAMLFEVTQSCPSAALPKCPPQVATMLMTMLTNCRPGVRGPEALGGRRRHVGASISLLRAEAARLDLLVPGVSLLLSKMTTLDQSPALSSGRCEGPSGAVCMWATELLNLLKMPSVAQFIFTASMEVSQPRLHHDASTAFPLALRIVSQLVEKEAGLLPGEGAVTRAAAHSLGRCSCTSLLRSPEGSTELRAQGAGRTQDTEPWVGTAPKTPFHMRPASPDDLPGSPCPWVSLFLPTMRTPTQSPATSSVRCRKVTGAVHMPATTPPYLPSSVEVPQPHYHHTTNTDLHMVIWMKEAGLLPEQTVSGGHPPGRR